MGIVDTMINASINSYEPGMESLALGGMIGLVIAILVIISIFLTGLYIYSSIAWQRIGLNQKYKCHWMAWIPFARTAMRLEMGGFHWALIFLMLVPILGWLAIFVLKSIVLWRIFEKSKYPGWLALSYPLITVPYLSWVGTIGYYIAIGFVAWKKQ